MAAAGGQCRREGDLVPENALRGAWRMRCATGDLKVTVTLAPDPEARFLTGLDLLLDGLASRVAEP